MICGGCNRVADAIWGCPSCGGGRAGRLGPPNSHYPAYGFGDFSRTQPPHPQQSLSPQAIARIRNWLGGVDVGYDQYGLPRRGFNGR